MHNSFCLVTENNQQRARKRVQVMAADHGSTVASVEVEQPIEPRERIKMNE